MEHEINMKIFIVIIIRQRMVIMNDFYLFLVILDMKFSF